MLGSDLDAGVQATVDQDLPSKESLANETKHKDEDQVMLDVGRSFVYYPSGMSHFPFPGSTRLTKAKDQSDESIEGMKAQLAKIIICNLRKYPMLSYFQGYHDIVQVLLLVLGPKLAMTAVAYVSLLRIRDFMLPSLSPSLDHLQLLPAILYCVEPKLCSHLSKTRPIFALASTLTLYAHDIQDYHDIARLFDFLLAHEASVSIYLFAVIIISRDQELFEIEPDDPEMLHFTLSKLPKTLDFDALISRTMTIFREHPPKSLPFRAWSKVSSYSVLKTTRRPGHLDSGVPIAQSLVDGKKLFESQAVELRRIEFQKRIRRSLWKHRRPLGGVGAAVMIGILSVWLQRQAQDGHSILLSRIWSFLRASFHS